MSVDDLVNGEIKVLVHEEDGAFWAEVIEMPGCFATGDTMDDLWECLTEAMSVYLSEDDQEVIVQVTDRRPSTPVESFDARVLVG